MGATTKTKKPEYWELLQDPRWQRKRLEVMERDEFACLACGATDKTLNVHHAYYKRGLNPWDYPLESLHTLCRDCHEAETKREEAFKESLGRLEIESRIRVEGYVHAIRLEPIDDADLDKTGVFPDGREWVFYSGMVNAWGMNCLELHWVLERFKEGGILWSQVSMNDLFKMSRDYRMQI